MENVCFSIDKIRKMKKIIIIVCCTLMVFSCKDNSVAKPDNLIAKDKMTDILYDITLLEAVKVQNLKGGINKKRANEYIYKKYKIDSIQFAKSNKYYASDLKEYKKMLDKIKERLTVENTKVEAEMKKNGVAVPQNPNNTANSDTPQVQ